MPSVPSRLDVHSNWNGDSEDTVGTIKKIVLVFAQGYLIAKCVKAVITIEELGMEHVVTGSIKGQD